MYTPDALAGVYWAFLRSIRKYFPILKKYYTWKYLEFLK